MAMDRNRCPTSRDSLLVQEQYDKIYRFCYFKLHNRELAEDITQEAFLRYLERYRHASSETALKYLYTIAGNLCIDEFRKPSCIPLEENPRKCITSFSGKDIRITSFGNAALSSGEDELLTALTLHSALQELSEEEQELLLLKYVNEVPTGVIAKLLGISRFALRRRLLAAVKKLKVKLRKEDFS